MQSQFALLLVQGSQQPVGLLLVGPVLGVIGSLAGVFFGFWLANRQRRQDEKDRAKAIRRMLQTEINHNVSELRAWCEDEESKLGDFPVQSNQIWSTNLSTKFALVCYEGSLFSHFTVLSTFCASGRNSPNVFPAGALMSMTTGLSSTRTMMNRSLSPL